MHKYGSQLTYMHIYGSWFPYMRASVNVHLRMKLVVVCMLPYMHIYGIWLPYMRDSIYAYKSQLTYMCIYGNNLP
jgi:hypothetical protein